jgi:thiamine-phosphate diphosphorylase
VIPRVHLVTDDGVLAASGFVDRAAGMMARFGGRVALHVRGHGTGAAVLYEVVASLWRVRAGALLLANDRVDIALAVGLAGVQLGARSLPTAVVRGLVGREALIGRSTHSVAEARRAAEQGADFVLLGTVFATTSHAHGEPLGVAAVAEAAGAGVPVIAIGGVTPARAAELAADGVHGVAVRSGVWDVADPAEAAESYLAAMGA